MEIYWSDKKEVWGFERVYNYDSQINIIWASAKNSILLIN